MIEKLNKNKITADWLNLFSDFSKYKIMHIIKRNGCFLSGLQFESLSSQRYRVCFHLYNLMVDLDIPTIPLISATYLLNKKGAINSFSMQEHDNDLESIVNELYNQIPILTKQQLTSNDLIAYMKGTKNAFYDKTTLTDIVLLNYYCGNDEQAEIEIEKGKKIAVMGSNGSGKSTFFLCCNGIHRPSSGNLFFHGKEIGYSRRELLELRSNIGIVFQDPDNQLFSASVYEEISFGILNLGVSKDTARQAVSNIISKLEITPFQEKPTHALSGGQKKQVAIADILVMQPEILILDEPAASLDPKHTDIVRALIAQLSDNDMTILIATHDADYAFAWADEVVLIHEGSVLKSGTPFDVFSDTEALARTNLRPPSVLPLFQTLCRKHILSKELPVPRTLTELEQRLEALPDDAKKASSK